MTEPARGDRLVGVVRRPHFFDGRLLTAADLEQEQQYQRDMRYLVNRALGLGVVEGLDVRVKGDGIIVSPGFAIDAFGREVVLAEAVHLVADDALLAACPNPVVTVTWAEVLDGALPTSDPVNDPPLFTSWLEQPGVSVEPAETVRPPSLVLARIKRRRKAGLTVDASARDGFRLRSALGA
jgi:hypothetical protein